MLDQKSVDVYQSAPDEISITEIFYKLWRARGIVLMLPIIFGVLSLILVLLQQVRIAPTVEYYISLTGIEKSNYPNGTQFSVHDLTAPEVISAVAAKLELPDSKAILDAVDVSLNGLGTTGILQKYQARLNRQGLLPAEIDNLNQELGDELHRDAENTIKITVRYNRLNVPRQTGQELARALPKAWEEIFTTKYRILDATNLPGQPIDSTVKLHTSLGALEGSRILAAIKEGVDIIRQDSRLSLLQTDDKVTAAELTRISDNFDNIYMSAILSLNPKQADGVTEFYTSFYINEVQLDIEQVNEQINGFQQTIDDIGDIIASQQEHQLNEAAGSDSIEVTGNALDAIVTLANQASLSSYLTSLFDAQAKLIDRRSTLRVQLRKITEAGVIPTAFMERAQFRFDRIIEQYNQLLALARDMNRRNNATLFSPIGAPMEVEAPLSRRAILIIVLAMMIGGLVAMVYALIRPTARTTEHAT